MCWGEGGCRMGSGVRHTVSYMGAGAAVGAERDPQQDKLGQQASGLLFFFGFCNRNRPRSNCESSVNRATSCGAATSCSSAGRQFKDWVDGQRGSVIVRSVTWAFLWFSVYIGTFVNLHWLQYMKLKYEHQSVIPQKLLERLEMSHEDQKSCILAEAQRVGNRQASAFVMFARQMFGVIWQNV